MNKVLFYSEKDDWATPQWLFDYFDYEYHFDLDPCASDSNHKCKYYFTKEINGLTKSWAGHSVFCNPPYGRDIYKWVKKCYEESYDPNTTVVLLVPARTDTKWFHDFILDHSDIFFIRGRLSFNDYGSAPFPSMVVVFNPLHQHICYCGHIYKM